MATLARAELAADPGPRGGEILTEEALGFVAELERTFGPRRQELLQARAERQRRLDAGELPDFLPETREVRDSDWAIEPVPPDLLDRRVEITGPTDRKMVINALNSGARMFMADFEDANSPTWPNMVEGQANLIDAIERTIELETPEKTYRLDDEVATLLVRPRGWHLPEQARRRRRRAGLREPVRLRPVPLPQRRAPARARQRALPVPAEAREPSRGTALERRLRPRRGGARPAARVDQGDGADRDGARSVRDGRDPLGAARALRRAERGPLGLHVQRDQEVPRPAGVRPPRPEQRDHDGALHARLHRAARQDLPPARRSCDGRHGGFHPEPQGRRAERARAGEGA